MSSINKDIIDIGDEVSDYFVNWGAWDRICEAARLGAAVMKMPVKHALFHRDETCYEILIWDSEYMVWKGHQPRGASALAALTAAGVEQ